MPVQKRKCSSCTFFNESPLPGNGWCTHPKRQLSSEVRILVRKGELACRDPWGSHYWTGKDDTPRDASAGEPARHAPSERLVAGPRGDDQVTSVTASSAAQTGGSDPSSARDQGSFGGATPEDVIVSQPSMLPEAPSESLAEKAIEREQHDLNLPAHEDQRERVRLIARGNRDAIVKARERVVLRRGGGSPEQDGDAIDADDTGHHPDDGNESGRFADATDVPVSLRFRRRQRDRDLGQPAPSRQYADPTPPVPPEEVGDRGRNSPLLSRRTDAERFESVPEVRPDVALPKLRKFLQTTEPDTGTDEGATNESGEQAETTYDRVLQQAQAIKTATRRERDAPPGRSRHLVRKAVPVHAAEERASAHAVDRDRAGSLESSSYLSTGGGPLRDLDTVDGDEIETTHASNDHGYPDNDTGHGEMDAHEDIAASFEDDDFPDDHDTLDQDVSYDRIDRSHHAGPRDSWWRGLTIGFRRRPDIYMAANDSASDDDMEDETEWLDGDVPSDHDQSEDEWESSDAVERLFSFADPQRATPSNATPVRDSRAAEDELIDYELTDEVLETSFADDTDRIQAESWREDDRVESPPSRRDVSGGSRSRQNSTFALNDRQDLDAFRAALFGDDSGDPATSRRSERERHVSRHHRSPIATRDERSIERDDSAADETLPIAERQRYIEEPTFDIRNFVEQDGDPLDMRVQIAPEVPKACRTCRNFRPSESGERGWCTNDFAFTHRQMVDADAMPCQSSIGCWWLPSDASWMPMEDLVARDKSTPLTDRLIARRRRHEVTDDHAETEMYVREISTR